MSSQRKLYLTGGATLALLSLVWYISVKLTGTVEHVEALAGVVGQAIDAIQTIVLGYLGANVLDKAKGVVEALKGKKEESA